MTLGRAMAAASRGLGVERARLDVTSANISNANSMSTPFEQAYRRQIVILRGGEGGPTVERIVPDGTPLRTEHSPGHPYADAEGNIELSNVNPVAEMIDMMTATRGYEANIAAFNSAKDMMRSALEIGR